MPMLLLSSVVSCEVWGITDTLKHLLSAYATVRLMPSMAIEPFSTTYFKILSPALTVTQVALSSFRYAVILPVPSICPLTMWPPIRVVGSNARSRFTLLPADWLPRLVRRIVSAITSAVKQPPSIFVTVRHTPFTAILSPSCVFSSTFLALTVITEDFSPRCTCLILPISSTIPVNTLLPPHKIIYQHMRLCKHPHRQNGLQHFSALRSRLFFQSLPPPQRFLPKRRQKF